MRKSKFTEAQVVAALRECASGTPASQVARKLGVSERTLYVWKRRYRARLDGGDAVLSAHCDDVRAGHVVVPVHEQRREMLPVR
jgi:transposase-like protein